MYVINPVSGGELSSLSVEGISLTRAIIMVNMVNNSISSFLSGHTFA